MERDLDTNQRGLRELERKMGFEPTTLSLARRCSTTEPLPLMKTCVKLASILFCWRAEGQSRTGDTGIFSAVLYHLSYLGFRTMVSDPIMGVKDC